MTAQTKHTTNYNRDTDVRILQINIDRKHIAQDLLRQFAAENKIDCILGQEPTRKENGCYIYDEDHDCFAWINDNLKIHKTFSGHGYIGIECDSFTIITCYFSPNKTKEEFERYLNNLEILVKTHRKKVILAGDLNSKSHFFGSTKQNEKGTMLEEILISNDLVAINSGSVPTFTNANGSSIIDITAASIEISNKIKNWKVITDTDSLSGHRYITYTITSGKVQEQEINGKEPLGGWKIDDARKERLINYLNQTIKTKIESASDLTKYIQKTCDDHLTRKKAYNFKHKPAYWWTEKISNQRKKCTQIRRTLTRRNATDMDAGSKQQAKDNYKDAKSTLKKMIRKEKYNGWKKLCNELEEDIWGQGYKIVCSKFKGKPTNNLDNETQLKVYHSLFPTHDATTWTKEDLDPVTIPQITKLELENVIKKMKNKKAPGPDAIPLQIIKLIMETRQIPEKIREIMNNHIKTGTFPDIWKTAKLMLIPKPKKNPTDSQGYRPICLIDTLGKILEGLIKERLERELEDKEIINEKQFGFRKGRSTISALSAVEQIVKDIDSKAHQHRQLAAMVTLDIKNAFNSAPWSKIVRALEEVKISGYIRRIVQEYLENRQVILTNGQVMNTTCGVPQGSVLAPLLWNVFYNKILEKVKLKDTFLIAYADDLAIITTAKTKELLKTRTEIAVLETKKILDDLQLEMATEKTGLLILKGRRKMTKLEIEIGNTAITDTKTIKYMGLWIDKDFKFRTHIKETYKKTNEMIRKLSYLTRNTYGPSFMKRKTLMTAALSCILYGAQIWGNILNYKHYEEILEKLNRRMALKITQAYRTAPTTALLVLAKTPPIKLQVKERSTTYIQGKHMQGEAKKATLESWKSSWSSYEGKAKIFIADLELWLQASWTESDHYVTQIITGHGVFGEYLFKIGKRENAFCKYCQDNTIDDAVHTLLKCKRWDEQRQILNIKCGEAITRENIATLLVESRDKWESIKSFMTEVIKTKIEDEKIDQI